ncbi:MAG TPA: hypothetical protein PLW05_08995 [Candidatus Marinimicrobia bacterium]|nr:hypothetical protein [Candidatus Neomarinimicrobiota bacterium]HQH56672.1 hypothetical protein [Candidatus Neomarinimicrobiota bacterium]
MVENIIITKEKIFISADSDVRVEIVESEVKKYLPTIVKIQSVLEDRNAKPAN